MDTMNIATEKQCYKCGAPKPDDQARNNWRWMCPNCSTYHPLYSVAGADTEDRAVCPNPNCKILFRDVNPASPRFTNPGSSKMLPDRLQFLRDHAPQSSALRETTEPVATASSGAEGAVRIGLLSGRKRVREKNRGEKRKLAPSEGEGPKPLPVGPRANAEDSVRTPSPQGSPSSDESPEFVDSCRGRMKLTSKTLKPATSGARIAKTLLAPVVAATLPQLAESAAGGFDAAIAATAGCAALGLYTLKRSTETIDVAFGAISNVTEEVIRTVGDEVKGVVPVFMGALVIMLLLILRFATNRLWKDQKEDRKEAGETPEGNVSLELRDSDDPVAMLAAERSSRWKKTDYPHVAALGDPWIQDSIANCGEAWKVALTGTGGNNEPDRVQVLPTTVDFHSYKVTGMGRTKGYIVKLRKSALEDLSASPRDAVDCKCSGHSVSLVGIERNGMSRVCYHCGSVLIRCMLANVNAPYVRFFSVGPSGEELDGLPQYQIVEVPTSIAVTLDRNTEDTMPRVTLLDGGSAMTIASPEFIARNYVGGPRASPVATSSSERPILVGRQWMSPNTRTRMIEEPFNAELGFVANDLLGIEGNQLMYETSELMNGIFPREGGGKVLSLMHATQTQAVTVKLLERVKPRDSVTLVAYTFNCADVCHALGNAARLGVRCKLYVDYVHTMSGSTQNQPEMLWKLQEKGVEVVLVSGRTSSGILHAKMIVINHLLILGSCNWTQGSVANNELNVLIHLNDAGKSAMSDWIARIEYPAQRVRPFTRDDYDHARNNRKKDGNARARSAPPRRRIAQEGEGQLLPSSGVAAQTTETQAVEDARVASQYSLVRRIRDRRAAQADAGM